MSRPPPTPFARATPDERPVTLENGPGDTLTITIGGGGRTLTWRDLAIALPVAIFGILTLAAIWPASPEGGLGPFVMLGVTFMLGVGKRLWRTVGEERIVADAAGLRLEQSLLGVRSARAVRLAEIRGIRWVDRASGERTAAARTLRIERVKGRPLWMDHAVGMARAEQLERALRDHVTALQTRAAARAAREVEDHPFRRVPVAESTEGEAEEPEAPERTARR